MSSTDLGGNMATIFSHAVAAVALGKTYTPQRMAWRFWVLTVLCSVLPDIDVIGFAFGIRYGDLFGHRGITHSLFFALLLSCAVVLLFFKEVAQGRGRGGLVAYFALVTASHPLLDAMTNGGLGVALFAPFDSARYFLPWRPIEVSPIGMDFFSSRGMEVMMSEIVWIWLPSLALILVVWLYRHLARRVAAH
jgi:inner membrane protein